MKEKIMSENAEKCFKDKFDSQLVYRKYVSFIESFKQ